MYTYAERERSIERETERERENDRGPGLHVGDLAKHTIIIKRMFNIYVCVYIYIYTERERERLEYY